MKISLDLWRHFIKNELNFLENAGFVLRNEFPKLLLT